MTEGPFRPQAAFGSADSSSGPVDRAEVDWAEDRDSASDIADTDAADTTATDIVDTTAADDTDDTGADGVFECGPVDLSEMTDLLAESEVDRIWVDLDGDLVADPEEAVDGPFTVSAGGDPAYDIAEAAHDTAEAEDGTADSAWPADDVAFDSWITFPVTDGAGPLYDLSALAPVSPNGIDWTTPGAHGYDPMTLSNYSVEGGPVLYDPNAGLSYHPADYTDPGLWYNQGAYDTGAGYWDPAYSSTPSGVDPSGWTAMPDTDPMAFDQLSAGYDPMAAPGLPTYTPMEGTTFDPNNPLPTYTPMEGTSFDPNNPLPTYTPYDAGAGMPAVPGTPGYLPLDPGTGYDGAGYTTGGYDPAASGSWMDAYSSSYDPSAGNPTDIVSDYYTDPTFDNQLSQASAESGFWMDQYDQASELESQYWQASVDASIAGDGVLAYDLNQLSLESGSMADSAWSYSNSAYDYTSTSSGSTGSVADDGWYDAMSLDS